MRIEYRDDDRPESRPPADRGRASPSRSDVERAGLTPATDHVRQNQHRETDQPDDIDTPGDSPSILVCAMVDSSSHQSVPRGARQQKEL